mgnify:CR=1 FL=1
MRIPTSAQEFRRFLSRVLSVVPPKLKFRIYRTLDQFRKPAHYDRPEVDVSKQCRLIIGPANHAEQAWHWARATERHLNSVDAISMFRQRGPLAFRADYRVDMREYRSTRWSISQKEWLKENFTHVLIDGIRPILGPKFQDDCLLEVDELLKAGLKVGLIAHGSEIRVPSIHAELYPTSPFRQVPKEYRDLVAVMEKNTKVWHKFFNEVDVPTFVSTVDLLDFAPSASYLPTIIDPAEWETATSIQPCAKPVVLHIPTNPFLKGSNLIDPILNGMDQAGVITYLRLEGVEPSKMPSYIHQADIVVDQCVLGLYSVMAIQAMAAGRIAIAHVPDWVRNRVPGGNLPVIDATADDLESTILDIISNFEQYRSTAQSGPQFVRQLHTGVQSAMALESFIYGGRND